MDDLTNWQCPNCGAMNVDCEKETVFPMCEVCGESFEWLEICPTKHAPDVVESAASSDIFPASEVPTSEADSSPALPQVM